MCSCKKMTTCVLHGFMCLFFRGRGNKSIFSPPWWHERADLLIIQNGKLIIIYCCTYYGVESNSQCPYKIVVLFKCALNKTFWSKETLVCVGGLTACEYKIISNSANISILFTYLIQPCIFLLSLHYFASDLFFK